MSSSAICRWKGPLQLRTAKTLTSWSAGLITGSFEYREALAPHDVPAGRAMRLNLTQTSKGRQAQRRRAGLSLLCLQCQPPACASAVGRARRDQEAAAAVATDAASGAAVSSRPMDKP